MAESNNGKRGRGRPEGSKNKSPFVRIPLSTLMNQLAPTAEIPVKKSFAEEILGVGDDSIEDEDYTDETPIVSVRQPSTAQ